MRPIDLMPKSISDRNIYESRVIDDFIQSIGFNGYLYHASGCVPEIFPRSVTVTNGDEQTLDYFASHSPMSPEPLFKSQQNGFRNVYSAIKVRNKKGHTYEGRIASLKEIKYIPLRVISGIAAYFLLWSKSNIELDVTDSAARRILSVFMACMLRLSLRRPSSSGVSRCRGLLEQNRESYVGQQRAKPLPKQHRFSVLPSGPLIFTSQILFPNLMQAIRRMQYLKLCVLELFCNIKFDNYETKHILRI